jgi:hypothetical protein
VGGKGLVEGKAMVCFNERVKNENLLEHLHISSLEIDTSE